MTRIYAGIGSRQTPEEMLCEMAWLAKVLSDNGWLLRSGHADGADQAFETGAQSGPKQIFIPWAGFNGAGYRPHIIVPKFTYKHENIARAHHPNWGACSEGAKKLHMRNVCQILGEDLDKPADMVVCWTPNGSGSGGTGQAIRIASEYSIPVFDLAIEKDWDALASFINKKHMH